jgi:hypothetical protein
MDGRASTGEDGADGNPDGRRGHKGIDSSVRCRGATDARGRRPAAPHDRGTRALRGREAPNRSRICRDKGPTPRGKGMTPRGKGTTPRGKGTTPRGKGTTPRGKGTTPRDNGPISRGKGPTSRGKGTTSRGKGTMSRGKGMVSRGKGTTSRGKGLVSRGKGIASRGKGIASRGKDIASRGKGIASRGKGATPRSKGTTPRGNDELRHGPTPLQKPPYSALDTVVQRPDGMADMIVHAESAAPSHDTGASSHRQGMYAAVPPPPTAASPLRKTPDARPSHRIEHPMAEDSERHCRPQSNKRSLTDLHRTDKPLDGSTGRSNKRSLEDCSLVDATQKRHRTTAPDPTSHVLVATTILSRIHAFVTGKIPARPTLLETMPVPTALPEEACCWDASQPTQHWWGDAEPSQGYTAGTGISPPARYITPKADGVPVYIYYQESGAVSRSLNIAGYSHQVRHGGLFICEPRRPPTRVVWQVHDPHMLAEMDRLPFTELVLAGELVNVPGRRDVVYIVTHDILYCDDTRGAHVPVPHIHPRINPHVYTKPKKFRLFLLQKVHDMMQEPGGGPSLAGDPLMGSQHPPEDLPVRTMFISPKPVATSIDACTRMFHSMTTPEGADPIQFMRETYVMADHQPPPVSFVHDQLPWGIPVDGVILIDPECGGFHGRNKIAQNLFDPVAWAGGIPPQFGEIKMRFWPGADFWMVPSRNHRNEVNGGVADMYDLVHYHPSPQVLPWPPAQGSSGNGSAIRKPQPGSAYTSSLSIPHLVQTWNLPKTAVGRAIQRHWTQYPNKPLVVECVFDDTQRWCPTKLRPDKTRCNDSRTVAFAQKATMVFRTVGGGGMLATLHRSMQSPVDRPMVCNNGSVK